jgi:glycosyltransferase involved in cell wall biosynthesis/Ser/Thr protein kinase RdoA (MazF antagonist)
MTRDRARTGADRRLSREGAPCRDARSTTPSGIGADARQVLNKRLDQLNDTPSMRQALSAAIEPLVGEPVAVEAYEVHFCKLEPWVFLDTALTLTLRCRRTDEVSRRHVSCTFWSTTENATRQYNDELSGLVDGRLAAPSQTSPSQRAITLVPGMAMVVRLFPVDPALTGLAAATDKERMMSLLERHLRECREDGWRPAALDYEVMRYKPGHLCTLRYRVRLEHPQPQPALPTRELYGKVFRDDRWQHCYALLEATWRAACASDSAWCAARPVASVPEWRFVLQESVTGRQFRDVVADLPDQAIEPELSEAERRVRAVATAVRAMQLAPIALGPRWDFGGLLESQESNLAYLRQCQPVLAEELTRLRKELSRVERAIPIQPLVFAHGDLAHGNVLLDGETVGIVDFDKAGQAEPAFDVAYFLTHLSSFGIRHPERQHHVARLREAFRSAYLAMAPEVSPQRLALYEALDLSAYVLRNFRKRSHEDTWLEWSRGQTALAWERMCYAAAGTRAPVKGLVVEHRSGPVGTTVEPAAVVGFPSVPPRPRNRLFAGSTPRLGYLANAFPRISETFILNEVLELERQGFDLRIYALKYPTDTRRHRLASQVRSPVTYVTTPSLRALAAMLRDHRWTLRRFASGYLSMLGRVLTAVDPDLVVCFLQAPCLVRLLLRDGVQHLHAAFVHSPGSAAWIVHGITGMPYSVATHARDLYFSRPVSLRRKLAPARVVFTCTRYNVEHLQRNFPGPHVAHLRRVYHGTDLDRFQFGPYGLATPPLVLAVARLVEKKGLDDLIRACAVLRSRRRPFRCRIVGSGVLRERLESLIRQEYLDKLVSLEGEADQEEVLYWYRQAKVLVSPCVVTSDGDRDGIPNALVEAAACGVPMVSTRVSGIPELVKHGRTGLLVPPGDPLALAEAIDKLLRSPDLREQLRVGARRLVEAEFDLHRNALTIGRELCEAMALTPPLSHATEQAL